MKYGREVAAVELHAFDDVEFGLGGLGFLDRDDAFVADLLHRVSDHLADFSVAVGRNGADLGHLVRRLHLLGAGLDVLDGFSRGHIDAALQVHRVHAGGHVFGAFANDRLGQNGRGGGAVAGDVVGLRGDLADHLGAHVLELVCEFDFLGDRHAVLGDARSAEGLLDDDVAALGTERDLHGIGKDVDALEHLFAGIGGEFYVFGSHGLMPPVDCSRLAEGSSARDLRDHAHDVGFLHDQEVLAVDLDLGAGPLAEEDAIARLHIEGDELAALVAGAGADGDDFALLRLFLGGVGDDDAALRLLFASRRRTTTRSCSGRNFMELPLMTVERSPGGRVFLNSRLLALIW